MEFRQAFDWKPLHLCRAFLREVSSVPVFAFRQNNKYLPQGDKDKLYTNTKENSAPFCGNFSVLSALRKAGRRDISLSGSQKRD